MDNRNPYDESTDEMEDCEDALQDQPPMSSRCGTTFENQVLASDRQDKSENQPLPSGISVDASCRTSVPNYEPSLQALNIDQPDKIFQREVFFFSSRKLRQSKNYSRRVDALLLPGLELKASEGSRRIPRPWIGQGASQNQQIPSDISAKMSVRSSLSSAGPSQALNTGQLDATPSREHFFYTSRELRVKSGCSRTVDALLLSLQNQTPLSTPVLEHLNVTGAETNQIAPSPVGERCVIDSASPPQNVQVSVTRSLSKSRSWQETDSPSLEKQSVETSMETTPTKRRKKMFEETQSVTFMASSVVKALNLEDSQYSPVIQNPDLPSSSSEMLDSGIGTRGLTASPSSCTVPNPYLPEQSSSSSINVPHHVLEFEISDDKKDGTDGNSSDSSTRTPKPNAEARSASRKGSNLEVIRRSKCKEALISRNVPENFAQQGQTNSLIESPSKSLPEIAKDVSQMTSRKRSDMGMDVNSPCIGEAARQPLTSSHQPQIRKGSSDADRSNSSLGNEETGGTIGRASESNGLAGPVFTYASNAQDLLFTVLGEIMNFNGQKDQYIEFSNLCPPISEACQFVTGMTLQMKLILYLMERKSAWDNQNLRMPREITLAYHIQDAYEILIEIVVTALISTVTMWSCLDFDPIIKNYETFKSFYNKCSLFWDGINEEELPDEASGNRVKVLKEMIPELLLNTKVAFKFLLLHTGKNAHQSRLDIYVEKVREEDKCFIKKIFKPTHD